MELLAEFPAKSSDHAVYDGTYLINTAFGFLFSECAPFEALIYTLKMAGFEKRNQLRYLIPIVHPHGGVGTRRPLVQVFAQVRNEPVISFNRMQRLKRRHIEIEHAKDVINDVIPKWMKIRSER